MSPSNPMDFSAISFRMYSSPCKIQCDVCGTGDFRCQLHERLLDDTVIDADTQFQNGKAFSTIMRDEILHLSALVLDRASREHLFKSPFYLKHTVGVES